MKRLVLLTGLVLAALLALAGPAFAHVTVSAPGAVKGGTDQPITFEVPVEKKVDTVGLTVSLPLDTPLAGVLVAPTPGWTHTQQSAELDKPIETDDGPITEAVSQIDWTAGSGQGLKPGEVGRFTIIAGLLPDADSVTFKVLQTYADGSVVKWIERAAPGASEEPESPAPMLKLAAGGDGSAEAPSSAPSPVAKAAEGPSNTGPVVLSIIALVVAAGALGLAVVTRARGRT